MLKLYTYQGCSTCRAAVKWLRERSVPFAELPIRETPPSVEELSAMLEARGSVRELCNTSGLDYRTLGLKDKLPAMSRDEVLALLASNGNLIKRPFALDAGRGVFLTGFKEPAWETALGTT